MKRYIEHHADFLYASNLNSIEVFLIVVLLFGIYGNNLLSVEFQPDETFWIVSSVRFDEFIAGDFDSPVWNQPFVNYEVRPIPSYIVAISQRIGGIGTDDLPAYWQWSLSRADNIARGAMPSETILWWSRVPMAIISVLSLLVTAILIAKAHSRTAAYLFVLISFNDYFLLHLRRAMSEAALLFFTVLLIYASFKLLEALQQGSMKRVVLWSMIGGIFCGLAGQSKLTGLATMAIPILGVLILRHRLAPALPTARFRTLVIVASLVSYSLLLIFVGSYPFFYRNTFYRTLGTFYFRGAVIEGQENIYASQVISPENRTNILFQRIFEYPVNLDVSGPADVFFHWINFLVVAFSIIYLVRRVWRRAQASQPCFIFLLATLTCAVPMLFVPLDWDRYYLYPVYFSCIFFSIGIAQYLLRKIRPLHSSTFPALAD